VNVHLLVDTKHDITLVPVAAIQRGPQGTYVYIAAAGNVAKIQAVTVAQTTGNLVGLASGVSAGTNVVIDGQDKLQDGTQINPTVAPMPTVAAAVNAPSAASPARVTAAPKNSPAAKAGGAPGAAPK
jgi:multidrug efflux system membrane fusion protein